MSLVAYSDSESEVEEAEEINIPRKKARTENAASNRPKAQLPPLPPSFRDLYATNVKLSPHDDPSLHEGRKRIIPHVPGRWPTHIQLEWYPNQQEMDLLGGLLEKASTVMSPGEDETKAPVVIRSLLRNDLGVQLPLHISLSRSVSLTTENKDLFPQVMRQAIEKSNIRP
ncbi:poly(U)-specific 3'-to-5' RNA exonuclease, partial [Ascosphaera atra]